MHCFLVSEHMHLEEANNSDWDKSILETLDLKSDLHLPEVH